MSTKRRVLITGANGNIGKILTSRLSATYDLVLTDVESGHSPEGLEVAAADLRGIDQIAPLMAGVDTVVHLAGDASPQATWESVYGANILGTRNVLEAARLNDVRRLVFTSSNHAMGMYDREGGLAGLYPPVATTRFALRCLEGFWRDHRSLLSR